MRFKATISNVPLFHKIVRSVTSLARICTIRLCPDQVHFIVPGNEGRDGVQVWSQITRHMLFQNYRIESNNDNEIWLEISLESLLKVLRSADSSAGSAADNNRSTTVLSESEVNLRLNKNGSQPVWVFDIKGKTAQDHPMSITHEINVHILTKRRQEELTEPICPPPDLHFVLPNLSELRNIVSRLGHVAEDVTMSANREGTMEMSVDGPRMTLKTIWKKLHVPASTDPNMQSHSTEGAEEMYRTTVAIKGLTKFLNSYLVGSTAVACICRAHCIIAYVYIGERNTQGGVLTFFIPAKNVDVDDEHYRGNAST